MVCQRDDDLGDVVLSGLGEAAVSLRLCVSVAESCFSPLHYLRFSYLRSLARTVKVLIRIPFNPQFLDFFFKLLVGSLNVYIEYNVLYCNYLPL